MSEQLDVCGLLCPLPLIRVQDKVMHLQSGDCLTVIGTDPGMLLDIPCWCRLNGHTIVRSTQTADNIEIVLQVGKDLGTD